MSYYIEDVFNNVIAKRATFFEHIVTWPYEGYQPIVGSYGPTTDFWIGENPFEIWHLGIELRASSYTVGLASCETNFYVPSYHYWTLDYVKMTRLWS